MLTISLAGVIYLSLKCEPKHKFFFKNKCSAQMCTKCLPFCFGLHYSDATWASWHLNSPATWMFVKKPMFSRWQQQKHQNSTFILFFWRGSGHWLYKGLIHPSTKLPLAGAAWNFSLSQAQQLCSAGLSVANLRKPRETLKEMQWKVVAENEVMDVRCAFTWVNLTIGTF